MFPPIPSWDALHPVIVHFPIALLLVAPLLILLAIFLPKNGRTMLVSAFILMALGTLGAWVAVSTGEAASELAEQVVTAKAALENHEELAETTRTVFTALTIIFGVILFAPGFFKKEFSRKIVIALNIGFLLFYSAGTILLINTGYQGGKLVHEFGIRAGTSSTAQINDSNSNQTKTKRSDDDD